MTIPIRFGFRTAGLIFVVALTLAVVVSGFLPLISPRRLGLLYLPASLLLGYFMLLRPGYELYWFKGERLAAKLFDRASYYPLAQLMLISTILLAEGSGMA
jgi:hypothetical protein